MTWEVLAQIRQVPGNPFGAAPPAPVPTVPSGWLVTAVVASTIAVLLVCLLLWRVRQLRVAVEKLAADREQPSPFAAKRLLPRFGVKTLLLAITIVAVLLGTFGNELLRARRQANVLNSLSELGNMSTAVSASYDLGLLGDSRTAAFLCHWINPHFGCRVTRLAVNAPGYRNYAEQLLMNDGALASIAHLQDLEELQICNADIGPQVLEGIARLKNLGRLSFQDCRLPDGLPNVLRELTGLEFLEICKCEVIDVDLKGLENLQHLTHLDLSWNPVTDEGMKHVSTLRNLRVLNLGKTEITGSTLEELKDLRRLYSILLNDTKVELDDLHHLLSLPELREVALYGSSVGWALKPSEHPKAEEIFADRPKVRIVWTPPGTVNGWSYADNRPTLSAPSGQAPRGFWRGP